MNRRAEKSLLDALKASTELLERFGNPSLQEYRADRDLQLITERLLIAVGESLAQAARADPALLDSIPDALEAIGLRNRVAHGYDDIRDEVIWDTAVNSMPAMHKALKDLLA